MDYSSFYHNKTVLITGHTGFKGAWFIQLLHLWGAHIIGISLEAEADSLYKAVDGDQFCVKSYILDINDGAAVRQIILEHQPDIIFHLAAQALVRPSYAMPVETFSTNVMGTIHVLDAMRFLNKKCAGVMITTDKVYENNDNGKAFVEDDKLGGYDPYAASKAACEIAISSYTNSFFNIAKYQEHQKSIASVRAGNVIGGGDMAKDRILPDIVRAIQKNEAVAIRNPNAIRPWQHVLEPLIAYAQLGIALFQEPTKYQGAYNIGPEPEATMKVLDVALLFIKTFGQGSISIDQGEHPHEAAHLTLDNAKIKAILGWKPVLTGTQAVAWSAEWYAAPYEAVDKCRLQIDAFLNKI